MDFGRIAGLVSGGHEHERLDGVLSGTTRAQVVLKTVKDAVLTLE
jgi:hypothetical protein